jgi:hypothetical protein
LQLMPFQSNFLNEEERERAEKGINSEKSSRE